MLLHTVCHAIAYDEDALFRSKRDGGDVALSGHLRNIPF